eukprot:CAMPEP_0196711798 /NCGR_PEP_ID=MMETSP1090-20130531/73049_1 /TAXON_ID=37098 /ORGANISM="Isochrysis sp, Strain CCMP1244" /LENGTH=76 /DNA_ID=CAMNT_0042051871 /DNA_START=331 /DNA_END=561 /DNA_ORIENTATION=+
MRGSTLTCGAGWPPRNGHLTSTTRPPGQTCSAPRTIASGVAPTEARAPEGCETSNGQKPVSCASAEGHAAERYDER